MGLTKPNEFKKLIKRIKESAPGGFKPFFFPVRARGKSPAVKKGTSWKSEESRLTPEQALKRLEQGENVGIAGRNYDTWTNVDIDDARYIHEIKPTLTVITRTGTGRHAYYFSDPNDKILPANIPTEKGEVRASEQYVVAPGSYVPVTEEELTKKVKEGEITEELKNKILKDPDRGVYRVENDVKIETITFDELPSIFQQKYKENKKNEKRVTKLKKLKKPIKKSDKHSALFDLEITDIIPNFKRTARVPHPLHDSETGQNFSLGNGVAHCWRHLVSLNAIQFLVVKSGYMTCDQAGTGHNGGNPSYVTGDDGAIFYAWLQAKKDGYIPKDDPLPTRAIKYIARKHHVCPESKIKDGILPPKYYNQVLKIVEEAY